MKTFLPVFAVLLFTLSAHSDEGCEAVIRRAVETQAAVDFPIRASHRLTAILPAGVGENWAKYSIPVVQLDGVKQPFKEYLIANYLVTVGELCAISQPRLERGYATGEVGTVDGEVAKHIYDAMAVSAEKVHYTNSASGADVEGTYKNLECYKFNQDYTCLMK